jgi:capsule polysaccharide export protein KpsE/RkpR
MGEVTLELIYKHMQAEQAEIKAELAAVRAEQETTSAKIGTLAASMVSMRKQIDDLTTTTRLIAVAVDDHSHRLDRIEKTLNLTHA